MLTHEQLTQLTKELVENNVPNFDITEGNERLSFVTPVVKETIFAAFVAKMYADLEDKGIDMNYLRDACHKG